MSSIREALSLGKAHFLTLFLSLLVFVFPLQLTHMFVSHYFNRYFEFFGASFLGGLFSGAFTLMALALAQIPFIAMVNQEKSGEEVKFGEVAGIFFQTMLPVYLLSLVYVLIVLLGSLLLVIPGLIMMVMLFTYPYAMILGKSKGWDSFKDAFWVGKNYFFKLCGVLLAYGAIDWLLGLGGLMATAMLTQKLLVVLLVQMFLNMLLLPFFVFVLSYKYLDWTE